MIVETDQTKPHNGIIELLLSPNVEQSTKELGKQSENISYHFEFKCLVKVGDRFLLAVSNNKYIVTGEGSFRHIYIDSIIVINLATKEEISIKISKLNNTLSELQFISIGGEERLLLIFNNDDLEIKNPYNLQYDIKDKNSVFYDEFLNKSIIRGLPIQSAIVEILQICKDIFESFNESYIGSLEFIDNIKFHSSSIVDNFSGDKIKTLYAPDFDYITKNCKNEYFQLRTKERCFFKELFNKKYCFKELLDDYIENDDLLTKLYGHKLLKLYLKSKNNEMVEKLFTKIQNSNWDDTIEKPYLSNSLLKIIIEEIKEKIQESTTIENKLIEDKVQKLIDNENKIIQKLEEKLIQKLDDNNKIIKELKIFY
ncbi:217_t:CDS:2 [Gigaspora margarita]|uniref:217_t:CDS:1 n=1 Tax=Gigaspora margarita TaxID=4874 RepID=A0ABN7UKH3_GIGMA|nr:217_t:CDS:2 [Gigaspora margarita]